MAACLLIPVSFITTYMHVQWHWFNVSVPVPNEAFPFINVLWEHLLKFHLDNFMFPL